VKRQACACVWEFEVFDGGRGAGSVAGTISISLNNKYNKAAGCNTAPRLFHPGACSSQIKTTQIAGEQRSECGEQRLKDPSGLVQGFSVLGTSASC
jgi:hypothetical protein